MAGFIPRLLWQLKAVEGGTCSSKVADFANDWEMDCYFSEYSINGTRWDLARRHRGSPCTATVRANANEKAPQRAAAGLLDKR
jgi:hypothetical protein